MTTQRSPVRAKLIAWIASLSLFVGFLPLYAYAATVDNAFSFSDSGIRASGSGTGYEINGTELTITSAGTYELSGTCADGSVTVKKGTTGVTLVLNGLTLTSAGTAPISCNKSSEVTIEAAARTVNTLTDSALNKNDNHPDNVDAGNAVIKCKDGSQVTICGLGTLNINANGEDGIKSGATTEAEGEARLTIRDVTMVINAPINDAISAEQLLNVESGTLTISAEDDAVHSDLLLNIGTDGTPGPTIHINKSCEGIEAANLNIYSGNITVNSSDDCLNAANSDLGNHPFTMAISGGTLAAYSSSGDGLDSNGSLTISGGAVSVWTANASDNQPLDADGVITISGGTVLAAGGSSGMGMKLTTSQPYVMFGPAGGMGGLRPDGPDGLPPDGMEGQRPGGPDGLPPDGMEGQRPGGPNGQRPDGMEGQRPDGKPGGMEGQWPGNIDGQQTGGTSISIPADSLFSIQDASGNAVYTGMAACKANYVFFSSSALTEGGSYELYSGGESIASAAAQSAETAGGFPQEPSKPGDGEHPGNPLGFTDVTASDWFYEAVRYVKDAGLMSGTSSTSFSPSSTTTRGMIAVILYRLAGSPDVHGTNTFPDVNPDAYYGDAVVWASSTGIANGYSSGTFGPNDAITREQLAAILYRYAQHMNYNVSAQNSLSEFQDVNQVSPYAKTALAWANAAGLINGTSTTALFPKGNAVRGQVAAILMRFCENVVNH